MATACMLRSALVRTCRLLHGLPRWKSRRVLEPNNFAGNELSLRELAFPFCHAFLVERPADLSVVVKLASDLRPATDSETTQGACGRAFARRGGRKPLSPTFFRKLLIDRRCASDVYQQNDSTQFSAAPLVDCAGLLEGIHPAGVGRS